jgi:hypothetical protein
MYWPFYVLLNVTLVIVARHSVKHIYEQFVTKEILRFNFSAQIWCYYNIYNIKNNKYNNKQFRGFVANRIIINCNVVYVHYYYLSLAKLNTKNPNLVLHVLCWYIAQNKINGISNSKPSVTLLLHHHPHNILVWNVQNK